MSRRAIISLVVTASGGRLSRAQAAGTWDKTIHPLGKKLGLLTGYVKPQAGTSKRTAAGNANLQREWHIVIDELFKKIKTRAFEVLKDERLVQEMMPSLICNLDEECIQAQGKNGMVVGSKSKKNTTTRMLPAGNGLHHASPSYCSTFCSH